MSAIRNLFQQLSIDKKISQIDAFKLLRIATTASEKAELSKLVDEHRDLFSEAALKTLGKLPNLDGAPKPAGSEFAQMIKDGILDVTVGIGYDEVNSDSIERSQFKQGMESRGFRFVEPRKMSARDLQSLGIDAKMLDPECSYFVKSAKLEGKDVKVVVRYIDRNTKAAAQNFGEGFATSDIVMYGGHARYGSGPDFDHKDSADGNFVIGTPYDSHMAEIIRGKQNQLKVVKMKDDYQMMFFSACTSLNYRDELRSMLPNKNAENLDLIMSNKELYWNVTSENLLAVLDGVLGQQSKKDMEAKLQALNNNAGFTFDGFA